MVFHIRNAWCFRDEVPVDATRWTVLRPYWTDSSGQLRDDEIAAVMESCGLDSELIARVIEVANR